MISAFIRVKQALLGPMLSVLLLGTLSIGLWAQTTTAESARKAKFKPDPEYPALAKQNGIKGVARVLVTVQPDGTVSAVKELGGNPLLIDALARAVKKWRYERSDKISVEQVKAIFGT